MIPSLYNPFQHWASSGSIYLLSDTHFVDPDCKLMDPNWIEPDRQIEILNKHIRKNDTFVCLGDVGDPNYIPLINAGLKVLLLGNHDPHGRYKAVFDEVYAGPLFVAPKILLSHEPVLGLPWCLNIHGHDHSGRQDFGDGGHHLNLASNVCNFTPVNLGKLIKSGVLSEIDDIHRMAIDDRLRERSLSMNIVKSVKAVIG